MNSLPNSSDSDPADGPPEQARQEPQWRPLTRKQRRVAGVLVEKAKTTPDAYPMTLNALTTGCNQKSNRSPQMNLHPDEVQETLDELRDMGAVAEVQSGGRVPKYKHYMYEWLGVDKYEIAVMTELLLRGEQTIGELRGRASRMENIADMQQLKPVLDSLIKKDLLVELQPSGRGQMVTHNLFEPHELAAIKQRCASGAPAHTPSASHSSSASSSTASSATAASPERIEELTETVQELQCQLEQISRRVAELESRLS